MVEEKRLEKQPLNDIREESTDRCSVSRKGLPRGGCYLSLHAPYKDPLPQNALNNTGDLLTQSILKWVKLTQSPLQKIRKGVFFNSYVDIDFSMLISQHVFFLFFFFETPAS